MKRLRQPAAVAGSAAQAKITWRKPRPVASKALGRVLPVCEPILEGNELAYLRECIETGWISGRGAFVARFEEAFAAACGVRHAVACSSGTAALHLALWTLGIGPGDEVIVPTLCIVSLPNAVRLCGAEPVFVDAERRTWNMDPADVAAKITPRTRAILAMHTYGHPCDMVTLRALARAHEVWLIEDGAEALGASIGSAPVGSLGDAACFSLYSNKLVTAGEGGVVTTDDPAVAQLLRKLADLGYEDEPDFWHRHVGFNYRITNLQAAVALAQVERLDTLLHMRLENARRYEEGLRDVPGLRLPPQTAGVRNVHWMYAVVVEDAFGISRDGLAAGLAARGIESRPFFIPAHLQPIYWDESKPALPVAEELMCRGLCLPSSTGLRPEEIDHVVCSMREIGGLPPA
jgi:perosamine synthetase